jgi:hypothetical protein
MSIELNKKFEGKTIVTNCNNNSKRNIRFFIWSSFSVAAVILAILQICLGVESSDMMLSEKIMRPVIYILIFYLFYEEIKKKRLKIAKQYAYLEDVCFSKQWKVLTSNQIEARYVLTPVLMEKIKDIKKLFKGKYIDFSFFGNSLIFVIHTKKNMFETTSLFKPALNYTDIKDVVSQFYSIFSVIDILEGNNKKG